MRNCVLFLINKTKRYGIKIPYIKIKREKAPLIDKIIIDIHVSIM